MYGASMGLDIYGGTLTRYYSGQWKTIMQLADRPGEPPTLVVRPPGSLIDSDAERTRERIVAWRTKVQGDIQKAGALRDPFDWPEGMEQPYFTDKPDWPSFGAMVLLAAYTEREHALPKVLAESWEQDPILRAIDSSSEPTYGHLYFVEMWFPVSDMAVFNTASPINKPIRIGSLPWLLHHLRDLNSRTFQLTESEVEDLRVDVPLPSDRTFEPLARAGLGITLHIALKSMRSRVPVLLDY